MGFVLALLLLPHATAAASFDADVRVESPSIELLGTLDVGATAGSLAQLGVQTSLVQLEGVTGRATLVATNTSYARVVGPHVSEPTDSSSSEDVLLVNATLVLEVRAEPFTLYAESAREGVIVASGRVDGAGRPTFLPRDLDSAPLQAGRLLGDPPPRGVSWKEGWGFVGNWTPVGGTPLPSYPAWARASATLTGPFVAHARGGNLTIIDANGSRVVRLGSWADRSVMSLEPATVETQREVWLDLDATIAHGNVPLMGQWGLSAPSLSWTLSGDVVWPDATGEVTRDGVPTRIDHGTVRGAGTLRILSTPEGGRILAPLDSYAARGSWDRLSIDGAPVHAAGAPAFVPLVVGAPLVAILAWILYTRIAPHRLLDHAKRAAIHDTVHARPGIHLRELQRIVGGAWGPFTFHLGMLRQAGFLRFEKHGRYTAVFSAGSFSTVPTAHHPLARKIIEALATEGRSLTAAEIQERLGVSRQLTRYHLGSLERAGAVHVTGRGGARRVDLSHPSTPDLKEPLI